jgi:hypothetical protein
MQANLQVGKIDGGASNEGRTGAAKLERYIVGA